jgi:hypothetical protein
MDVRFESKAGPLVADPEQVVVALAEQLHIEQKKWLKELRKNPKGFAELEVSIHQKCQEMADQLVASLLAAGTQESPTLELEKKR